MAAKRTIDKSGADILNRHVEIKSSVNPLQNFEGTLADMGPFGAVITTEYRGYDYATLIPWGSIMSIEARTKADEVTSTPPK